MKLTHHTTAGRFDYHYSLYTKKNDTVDQTFTYINLNLTVLKKCFTGNVEKLNLKLIKLYAKKIK